MSIVKVCVQCKASNGKVGDFICGAKDQHREAISPVFTSLSQLYPWLKANGWEAVHDTRYPTGAYRKVS